MDILQHFISEELIYALGWTVMHSLWQGFVIAIGMALVLQVLHKKSAKVRYEVATFSLFMVLVSSVCTFIWHLDIRETIIEQEVIVTEGVLTSTSMLEGSSLQGFMQAGMTYFNTHLPMIVLIWLVGVGFFILRLFGGLAYVQRLKYQRTTLLPAYWQAKVKALTTKIPVDKTVRIFESASIRVPMVIGYFKPFILLPIGAINQLGEEEIEAIIAHELAHVFRKDFLLNIFLSFIEVFYYYHPAVWWISGNIRLERENCCDDIAIQVCGNSLTYAKALVRLQELNAYSPSFAMPFSGQKNQLLNRIKRILNQPQNRSNIMERLAATCFLLLALVFVSVSANHHQPEVSDNLVEDYFIENTRSEDTEEIDIDIVPEEDTEFIEALDNIVLKNPVEADLSDVWISAIDQDNTLGLDYAYPEVEIEDRLKPLIVIDGILQLNNTPTSVENVERIQLRTQLNNWKLRDTTILPIARTRQQKVTKKINEEGQTVIFVETAGQEPVEIIVEGNEGIIIVEGNELEDGDTAIIIDESEDPRSLYLLEQGNLFAAEALELEGRVLQQMRDAKLDYGELNTAQLKELLEFTKFKKLQGASDIYTLDLNQERLKELQLDAESIFFDRQELLKEEQEHLNELLHEHRAHQSGLVELQGKLELMGLEDYLHGAAFQIGAELKRDGLINDTDKFKFSLSNKKMKVDGKKQSKALHKKYKALYKKITGNELEKKSTYQININNHN